MPAKPAAYLGCDTQHGPGLLGLAAANVTINGRPAWRAEDEHVCSQHGLEAVWAGSEVVTINGRRAVRMGDYLQGPGAPNRIMVGSPNVVIGTPLTGLGSKDNLARFCAQYCSLVADWPKLTPEERKRRYEALLSSMAAQFGAPPISASDTAALGSAASWNKNEWTVNLPPGAWESDTPPAGDATLHELRHAEQTFLALRERAGRNQGGRSSGSDQARSNEPVDADDLEDLASVPSAVAKAAAGQPVAPDSEEARRGRVFADERLTKEGQAAMNDVIREVYAAAKEDGVASERYRRAAHGYAERPVGSDAADVQAEGLCGGCK